MVSIVLFQLGEELEAARSGLEEKTAALSKRSEELGELKSASEATELKLEQELKEKTSYVTSQNAELETLRGQREELSENVASLTALLEAGQKDFSSEQATLIQNLSTQEQLSAQLKTQLGTAESELSKTKGGSGGAGGRKEGVGS